jgi:hypothetical protein
VSPARERWTAPGAAEQVHQRGILALAVTSAAFTGQAIAVGFERQCGVLERLGATPLPRSTRAKTTGPSSVTAMVHSTCARGACPRPRSTSRPSSSVLLRPASSIGSIASGVPGAQPDPVGSKKRALR